MKNLKTGKIKYNPFYFAQVKNLQLFLENAETSKIKLWDVNEELGCIDSVDVRIIEFI